MSIRKVFAQQKVLELYQQMSNIEYPIRPDSLLQFLPGDCRILTYQKMAEVSQCTIQDIESMCNSTSGATHYDINTDRYPGTYSVLQNPNIKPVVRLQVSFLAQVSQLFFMNLHLLFVFQK